MPAKQSDIDQITKVFSKYIKKDNRSQLAGDLLELSKEIKNTSVRVSLERIAKKLMEKG